MPSLTEIVMTHPAYFGVQTATPVQRAICRASDGADLGELWDDANVRAAFGDVRPLPVLPRTFLNICAIRTGKSLWASATATARALTADLSRVRKGEPRARVPVLSTSLDNANIVFQFLVGRITSSPALASLVVSETADTIVLRRDHDDKEVEIRVVAGKRAGSSLVGRWLAGVVFEEATLMTGGSDGTVRDLDADLSQLEGRMLPGAQVIMIGSTMAPPRGPAHALLMRHWRHPTPEVCAVWSTGPEMRPDFYTAEHIASLASEVRIVSTTRTFLDPESSFLSARAIDACMRRTPAQLQPRARHNYVICSDPATRKNAWSLVVLGTFENHPTRRIVLAKEWKPEAGCRLSADIVLREIATIAAHYGCSEVYGDQYHADTLIDLAARHGIEWIADEETGHAEVDSYLELQQAINERDIELPPDQMLRRDLQMIRKKVHQNGRVSFVLPTTGDGRHCDYVPAIVKAVRHSPPPPLEDDDPIERDDALVKHMLKGAGAGVECAMRRIAGVN